MYVIWGKDALYGTGGPPTRYEPFGIYNVYGNITQLADWYDVVGQFNLFSLWAV